MKYVQSPNPQSFDSLFIYLDGQVAFVAGEADELQSPFKKVGHFSRAWKRQTFAYVFNHKSKVKTFTSSTLTPEHHF